MYNYNKYRYWVGRHVKENTKEICSNKTKYRNGSFKFTLVLIYMPTTKMQTWTSAIFQTQSERERTENYVAQRAPLRDTNLPRQSVCLHRCATFI